MSTLSSPVISSRIGGQLSAGAAPATVQATIEHNDTVRPTVGSTAGKTNILYSNTHSVSTSGTTLDLTSLTDKTGASISFSAVRAIKITNKSTTSGEDLTIGGGATNPIFPNALPLLKASSTGNANVQFDFGAGELTVDSTHKILDLDVAAGSAVNVDITIIGR